MGEYHRISGMIEQAGLADLLNPRLDEGQRRSLKALSSLRAAIEPPASLWMALGVSSRRIQSALGRLRGSIKLAERAVREKDDGALGTQSESIRGDLAGLVKFLQVIQSFSAHRVIQEYASAISSGFHISLAA